MINVVHVLSNTLELRIGAGQRLAIWPARKKSLANLPRIAYLTPRQPPIGMPIRLMENKTPLSIDV